MGSVLPPVVRAKQLVLFNSALADGKNVGVRRVRVDSGAVGRMIPVVGVWLRESVLGFPRPLTYIKIKDI